MGRAQGHDNGRLAGVEGLRAVAALSVLVYHAWYYGAGEERGTVLGKAINLRYGLVLFFVLSGFLLYRGWVRAAHGRAGAPDTGRFLWSRAFRILPAYWVVLLLTAWVLQAAQTDNNGTVGALTDPGTLLADLLLVQTYAVDTAFTGIGPAWTLGVELVFYLSLPLLGAVALWLARRRAVSPTLAAAAPALALIAVGLAMRTAMQLGFASNLTWGVLVHNSFPAQADLFGFGMLVAVYLERPGGVRRRPVPLLALAAVLLLMLPANDSLQPIPGGFGDMVAGIAFAVVLVAVLVPAGARVARLLDARPLAAAGRWSYSVYLWHTPLVFLAVRWFGEATTAGALAATGAGVLVATLALSAATYRFVEAPARAFGRRYSGALVTRRSLEWRRP